MLLAISPSGSATPGAGVWGSWRDRVAYYHDFRRYRLSPQFEWLLYVFGAFLLLYRRKKMALAKEDESGIGEKPMVQLAARVYLRMTDTIENGYRTCGLSARRWCRLRLSSVDVIFRR